MYWVGLEYVSDVVDEVIESPLVRNIGVKVNVFQIRMSFLFLLQNAPVLEELCHQVTILLIAIGQQL